jgi:hypothetical protein
MTSHERAELIAALSKSDIPRAPDWNRTPCVSDSRDVRIALPLDIAA